MAHITAAGDATEKLFLSLVPGAKAMPRGDARGDASIVVDGRTAFVEVKRACSTSGARQVRAIKFIPLVAFNEERGRRPWAVLSAVEVTKLVMRRNRGMHTELALECSEIPLRVIGDRFWHCPHDLPAAVVEAVRESRRYPQVEKEMQRILKEIRSLRDVHGSALLRALREDDAGFQYQLSISEAPL